MNQVVGDAVVKYSLLTANVAYCQAKRRQCFDSGKIDISSFRVTAKNVPLNHYSGNEKTMSREVID